MAGQISGLIGEVNTCKEIIDSLINAGIHRLEKLSSLKGGDN